MKKLSLVIPVYNAQDLLDRILQHVPDLAAKAEECGFRLVETIVVDDGSQPPMAIAPEATGGVRLLRNDRNRGKGFSVRRGALSAAGDWVLMSDVDESAPLAEFARLAPCADKAIVCGSRFGSDRRPWLRRTLSRVFNRISGTGLKDTQCGFKLFNMALMRPAFESLRTERFAFDVELIRNAPSVAEVPVKWFGRRRSSLKVRRDAPQMLRDLIRIRWGV
jgi:dolichyl-phosphate beta-glucosyltransferase